LLALRLFWVGACTGIIFRGAESEGMEEQMPFLFWAAYTIVNMSVAGVFLGIVYKNKIFGWLLPFMQCSTYYQILLNLCRRGIYSFYKSNLQLRNTSAALEKLRSLNLCYFLQTKLFNSSFTHFYFSYFACNRHRKPSTNFQCLEFYSALFACCKNR
jgi:hypothetical protein